MLIADALIHLPGHQSECAGNPEEIKNLTQEIEDYKLKLKTEFGYTKNDIAKDEDILEMQKRLKAMGH